MLPNSDEQPQKILFKRFSPEHWTRDTLCVGFVAFVVLLLMMSRLVGVYDEGIILTNAMRVLHGDIIHRDFYSNYGPAQYYLLALLFRLFPDHFFTARIYDLVVRAAIVAAVFRILAPSCSRLVTLVYVTACCLWLLSLGYFLYPIYPCLLLALIALLLLRDVDRSQRPHFPLFLSGLLTGLTALFRYDVGFFLFAVCALSIAVLIVLSPLQRPVREIAIALLLYTLGSALIFLPPALWYALHAPVQAFVWDIVTYPTHYYAVMRHMPFPGLLESIKHPAFSSVYLPILATVLGVAMLIQVVHFPGRSARKKTAEDRRVLVLLVLFSAAAGIFFLKGVVRVSPHQMFLGIVPGLIVFAIAVDASLKQNRKILAGVLLILSVLPPVLYERAKLAELLRIKNRSVLGWLVQRERMSHPSPLACESAPYSDVAQFEPDYAETANYLDAHSSPGEKILVGLDHHDRVVLNPVVLYFATDRMPGTHWHHFDPGLQTRSEIQREIISDLQANHVEWVIRDGHFNDLHEPNGSDRSSGVFLLDTYLNQRYRPVVSFGKLHLLLLDGIEPRVYNNPTTCDTSQPVPKPADTSVTR